MAPCPELHIPHKEWSGREELENYHAIEAWARTRGCGGGGCDCFFEHSTFYNESVPSNEWTVAPRTIEITVGSRAGWDDARTSMLVVNWIWEISDLSDGTMTLSQGYAYGAGVMETDTLHVIGASTGYMTQDDVANSGGLSGIAIPGPDSIDKITAGSFTTFLNQKHPGPFPNRWDYDVGVFVGLLAPDLGLTATFSGDTYEYGFCCDAQE